MAEMAVISVNWRYIMWEIVWEIVWERYGERYGNLNIIWVYMRYINELLPILHSNLQCKPRRHGTEVEIMNERLCEREQFRGEFFALFFVVLYHWFSLKDILDGRLREIMVERGDYLANLLSFTNGSILMNPLRLVIRRYWQRDCVR